ncbi:MAG: hypothetical protein WA364_28300 [Candidatus Nitrosopolaris sp.]
MSSEDNDKMDADVNCNRSPTAKTISSNDIIRLYDAGFRKLVPLLPDSKIPNVHDHLITEEEIKAFPSAEGRPVRIIHQKPNFWTEARLKEKSHLFYNVATTFGITDLKDPKGKSLYLYGVDIDSRQAYEALKDLIQTLIGMTFVAKTHKEYGYHFYVLSPIFHEPLGPANFKLGAEIEVKTDMSLGTMHLPLSRHRSYPYWNYTKVSTAENIYVDEEDAVFQKIIKGMSGFLRKEPTEENTLSLDAYVPSNDGTLSALQQKQRPNKNLKPEQIDKVVDIIVNRTNSYVIHSRNDFVYGLSGHLFHNGISELSTSCIVGKLCKAANDEDVNDRLDVVAETYKKGNAGKLIKGISQLKYLIEKYNEENDACVNEIIDELNDSLGIGKPSQNNAGNTSSNTSDLSQSKEDPVAKAMIELSELNGDIYFKDTFGEPYAIINSANNHVEVLSLSSNKFAYYLRTLLKRNKNKRIISNDSVEKAIETLKAEAIVEGRTIPLHLRVAWKKKNEIIYYDPTDDSWSCIAIGRDIGTWQILPAGSFTGYPIAELRNPNSKLLDQPVLFTRHSQIPQVVPTNYPPDIMQQFIDRCTNIRNPRDQLLFKAYVITLFIPDIAHPILLLKGVKGAAKSILETEVKRIIDPSQIELLILNNNLKDFVIQLARHYYNAYDNVIKILPWLSSIICAATTGAGFILRTLYTTADETPLKFKRCFALSSIGASLTEDDALERSISINHPKIEKQDRKMEEKILAEFDSLLPQLLGYIFDTVAKTMQEKDRLEQTQELDGKLERMADFSFWGEAAARVMGYKPMEFLNAYSENLRNQSRDAVNFNALADIMRNICDEELADKHEVEYTLPDLLTKVRATGFEIGIELDPHKTKFSWAKTPQSLSEEVMRLAAVIQDSYGYKIERYTDHVGKNGRKKNTSVIRITNQNHPKE